MTLEQDHLFVHKKFQLHWLILLTFLGLILSDCSSGKTPTASNTPVTTSVAPTSAIEVPPARVVQIAWTNQPDSLNRSYSSSTITSIVNELFGCSPWVFDEANQPVASMLTALPGVSPDGLVITMNLRSDLKWSDGQPLTSQDFAFTQAMITAPSNTVASTYPYDQFSITTPDAQTVVMTFKMVFAPWLSTLWQGTLMPQHILQPVFDTKGSLDAADWNMAPTVGCGPFNFAQWETDKFLRFDRNPNYWGTQAKLDEVVFQFVADNAARSSACLTGSADICNLPLYEDMQPFVTAGLKVVSAPSGYNEGWFFNFRDTASSGIRDLNVRRAIAMGLDRQSNTSLRTNLVKVNETFWDALPAYVDPTIEPYKYDPETAKTLLETNGYVDTNADGIREDKDGKPLTITQGILETPERLKYQQLAQQQMRAIGIDLKISSYPADTLFASYSEGGPAATGTLDILQWSDLPAFPDPDTTYWLCDQLQSVNNPFGFNYFGCDQTLDTLFRQQVVTADPQSRQQLFWQITKNMHDNVLYLGIWEDPDFWVINPRISGAKFSGANPFFNITEWDVTK